jgi:hypothetical protein
MAFQSDARFMKCGICHDDYKCFQMWESDFSPQVPDDPEAPGSASAHVDTKGVKRMRICSKCELDARLKVPEADRPHSLYATAPIVKKEMKRMNKGKQWMATGMHYAKATEIVEAMDTPMTQAEKSNAKTHKAKELATASCRRILMAANLRARLLCWRRRKMKQLRIILNHSILKPVAEEILACMDKEWPAQCNLNFYERQFLDYFYERQFLDEQGLL